jgi:hypothetical protein
LCPEHFLITRPTRDRAGVEIKFGSKQRLNSDKFRAYHSFRRDYNEAPTAVHATTTHRARYKSRYTLLAHLPPLVLRKHVGTRTCAIRPAARRISRPFATKTECVRLELQQATHVCRGTIVDLQPLQSLPSLKSRP